MAQQGRARIAVAAPNRAAADAALRMAALGGNAVDATVAALLVAMVSEPGVVSLAAGGYLSIWPAQEADAVVVDSYVTMPGLGGSPGRTTTREVRTEYGGGLTMAAGHGTVAVPGVLAGLDLAVDRWGRLPWPEVVAPAHEAARDGFTLGTAAGYYLPYVRDSLFAWDPETAAALRGPDGEWVRTGDTMVIPQLGDTLARIAEFGARDLYTGELAGRLVADMQARGGSVTAQDLAAFRPVLRRPLAVSAGPWALRTNPPPAIGGAVLAALLTLLGERSTEPAPDGDHGASRRTSAAEACRLVDVQRRILDVRHGVLDVAEDRLAAAYALLRDVGWREPTAPSTVHVSVVDADGSACAGTASSGYGSGATVPGTGLWLNNSLGELELNRGAAISPGERLRSNMTPTVGRRTGGGALAVGSPGADRITTAVAQVLAAFAYDGLGLQDAIDRPRLHVHHLADGQLRVEAEEDFPLADRVDLPDGRSLAIRHHQRHSMYFGGVGAALRTTDGGLTAAADPRRAGAALTG